MGAQVTPVHAQHRNSTVILAVGNSRIKEAMVTVEVCLFLSVCMFVCVVYTVFTMCIYIHVCRDHNMYSLHEILLIRIIVIT